jgi:hypothetical protein
MSHPHELTTTQLYFHALQLWSCCCQSWTPIVLLSSSLELMVSVIHPRRLLPGFYPDVPSPFCGKMCQNELLFLTAF